MAKGFVSITVERCKGCGFCVEFCPTNVLSLSSAFNSKGYHPPHVLRAEKCSGCDLCGMYCPDFAIYGAQAMQADPKGVLTGIHFLDGDHACCEGALAAGARFAAGYPITPSTEVVERFSARIPTIGGMFIQMEDELAASIAIQGAVWGGAKAFTVTSGPGFSLMMEHIGYAAMTETPCVFVNVQRGGPSTGLPTLPAQADMMQARWGSHGDYGIIAVCPNSPQECFDLTIQAFNLSEQYRLPVMVMMDECVGHMTEKVVIPPAEEIEIYPRRHTRKPPEEFLPYAPGPDLVPEMAHAGEGYSFHVTGLTHDERGYPCDERRDAGPPGAPPARQTRAAGERQRALRDRGWKTPRWWWSLTASRRAWRSAPSKWRGSAAYAPANSG